MSRTVTRRRFLQSTAAAAAAGGLSRYAADEARAGTGGVEGRGAAEPAGDAHALGQGPGGPVVIASGNGLRATAKAMEMILAGADPLDAAVAGVNLVERDRGRRC